MENNNKILDEWNECISTYPKLNFKDAQKLYIELTNYNDINLKNKLNDNLITGTLYVVLEFIKKNGLIYLNSSSYDMEDVISICNEIWLNKINSGVLLNVNSFREIFDADFFNNLTIGLNIDKNAIVENTIFNIKLFWNLLFDYIKFKNNNLNCNYYSFIESIKTNVKYKGFFYYIYDENYIINCCHLFDAIIESLELGDADLNISKTKLEKLKYILIGNGIEYLRKDIDEIICSDTTEIWLDNYCRKEIMEIIFNGDRLNAIQKDIISKRYGIGDEKCMSLKDIATIYHVTRERIRQREIKALRMLRTPTYSKKIRELL